MNRANTLEVLFDRLIEDYPFHTIFIKGNGLYLVCIRVDQCIADIIMRIFGHDSKIVGSKVEPDQTTCIRIARVKQIHGLSIKRETDCSAGKGIIGIPGDNILPWVFLSISY